MITSASNTRIKKVAALNQKAKERRQEGKYVVEGVKMFLEAPDGEIEEVYTAEGFCNPSCDQKLSRLPVERVSEEVFRKMSDTAAPQGILCVMRQKAYTPESLLQGTDPLLMLLEDIQDPGNLGTILRTGEGTGVDGVIMSRETADIYNPKTIRSTMGSIYRVPFVYVSSLADMISMLNKKKIRVFAAHLKGECWYDQEDYCRGSAFLIGNEGNGLREETAALADSYIKIPMAGNVESLNAAMASGILMYEAARQRRIMTEGGKR